MFAIKALEHTRGGAERVFADTVSGLADRGYDITVISFDASESTSFYPLSPKIRRMFLPIGNPDAPSNFIEFFSRVRGLRRLMREEKPDIVIAFMHSMFVPVSFAATGLDIPIIASEHIVRDHYKNRPLEYLLLFLSSFKLSAITVLSESVRSAYPAILRKKMVVVPNPVKKARQYADVLGDRSETRTILNIGRLDPQKDQKTLIQAFGRIAPRHPEWHLKIFGAGDLLDELKALISSLGLEMRVSIEPPKADIHLEYEQAQIFALSSRYESFGLATAEAMAHGLPAIGFKDCPGTNELITDGVNGLLVSGGDRVSSFAEGLECLISNPDLRVRLGQEAVKSVDRYTIDNVLKRWEELLSRS